jgi:hypothetical protein
LDDVFLNLTGRSLREGGTDVTTGAEPADTANTAKTAEAAEAVTRKLEVVA